MTAPDTKNDARSDLDDSTVAQLIECGLLARYGRDPDGLQWARQAVRDELLAKSWTLPPYTYAAHDFRHAAMHRMADWPVAARGQHGTDGQELLTMDSLSVCSLTGLELTACRRAHGINQTQMSERTTTLKH
jgi:hypothetical protein